MALMFIIAYAFLLPIAFVIYRFVHATSKLPPAGCGLAPVHPSRSWWDILDLNMLLSQMYAACDSTLHIFERNTWDRLREKSGFTVRSLRFSRLGSTTIYTKDPININAVLVSQFPDFLVGGRRHSLEPLIGHQILSLDGNAWKQSRNKLRPAVTRERVSDRNAYETHTTALLKQIENRGQGGTHIVELQSLFEHHALVISMDFFGLTNSSSQVDDNDAKLFAAAFDSAQGYLVHRVILGKLYMLADSPAFRRACKACHDIVDKKAMPTWIRVHAFKHANPALKDAMPTHRVFDELVQVTDNYTQLRSDIIGLIIATRDNAAVVMTWMFYYLARYPETYALLREAVIEHFGHAANPEQPLSFEALKACTYLQYCIKESLRLEPPITRSMKTAAQNTTLPKGGGADGSLPIFVPKGTDVMWSTREMQRDQEYWGKDADEWRPDRWYTARPTIAYAPFNAGPRTCPGQQMGLTLVAYTMVRIVQQYERIESCETEDVAKIATGLVGFKHGGLKVKMIPTRF